MSPITPPLFHVMKTFLQRLLKLLLALRQTIAARFRPKRLDDFRHLYLAESGSTDDRSVKDVDILLIRGGTQDKWLVFMCPNRCGTRIALNLSPARRPCWRVALHGDRTVTVTPSIVHNACGAHFFIRHNRIQWV